MNELLLSVNAAARSLGIGRTKIYELVADGELTLVKLGKRSLITAASIDVFVSKLAEKSGPIRSSRKD